MMRTDTASPTDPDQYARSRGRSLPDLGEVRPGVWSIGMPYRPAIPYSLAYLLADDRGGIHVVDPGADSPTNRERLRAALQSIGFRFDDITGVTATHLHGDHSGLAKWISEATDAPLHLHRADAADAADGTAESRYTDDPEVLRSRWSVPAEHAARIATVDAATRVDLPARTVVLDGDDLLPIPGRQARVVHTPGHTRGHVCIALDELGLVLLGDHVFPRGNPGIARGGVGPHDDPVADYLASLERIAAFDAHEAAPGHGYRFAPLRPRRLQIRDHVLARARDAEAALRRRPESSVWDLASALQWRGGTLLDLDPTSIQSALLQTDCYARYVRNSIHPPQERSVTS